MVWSRAAQVHVHTWGCPSLLHLSPQRLHPWQVLPANTQGGACTQCNSSDVQARLPSGLPQSWLRRGVCVPDFLFSNCLEFTARPRQHPSLGQWVL